jgi:AcrR family transcriptional regulator
MNDPVKPKRKYDSSRRAVQAADTKKLVIDAARALFVASGWQATTIAAIARVAKVSPETIYSTFKNKETILKAVVEKAIRGDRPDTPLLAQGGPSAIAQATRQPEQIALFAKDIARVLSNVAEVMAVLRSAAEADPNLLKLYAALHEGRRRNLSFVAAALIGNGPLRDDMDASTATTHLWRLASPELFLLLTKVEGLSTEAYSQWLRETLEAQLLKP